MAAGNSSHVSRPPLWSASLQTSTLSASAAGPRAYAVLRSPVAVVICPVVCRNTVSGADGSETPMFAGIPAVSVP